MEAEKGQYLVIRATRPLLNTLEIKFVRLGASRM